MKFIESRDGARSAYVLESMQEDKETISGKLESYMPLCERPPFIRKYKSGQNYKIAMVQFVYNQFL